MQPDVTITKAKAKAVIAEENFLYITGPFVSDIAELRVAFCQQPIASFLRLHRERSYLGQVGLRLRQLS